MADHRFKADPNAVQAVCDEFFDKADMEQDGVISYVEYKKWVMERPEVRPLPN